MLHKRIGGDIFRRGWAQGDTGCRVASTPSHAFYPNNPFFCLWPQYPSGLSMRSVSGKNWSRSWDNIQSSKLPEQSEKSLGIIRLSLFKEEFRRTFCSSLDHIRGPAWYALASNALEVSKGMWHNHRHLQSQRHSNTLFYNWEITQEILTQGNWSDSWWMTAQNFCKREL